MTRKSRKIRVLLTGGGTGGHIYPLMAVAQELEKAILEHDFTPDIRYFGDAGNFKFYLESHNVRIVKIVASKWRRYPDPRNFLDIFKFFWSLIQGFWKIYWFMPHLVFSKGGPGALAVTLVTRFYLIPLIIHESDALPGLTNKISSRGARIVELAFETAKNHFGPKTQLHLVGNPVREEVLKARLEDPEEVKSSKREFGFNPEEPVILFLGGSQGAERINDFIFENIGQLTEKFQILHQVGAKNFNDYKKEYDFMSRGFNTNVKNRYHFVPYLEENIYKAYEAAEVVAARAGAGLIFETAALGKPAILIPLPTSANNHQIANAYEYEKAGAAVVIEEENLLPGVMIGEIERILKDRALYSRMSEAAKKFYIPDAAKIITEDILNLILI